METRLFRFRFYPVRKVAAISRGLRVLGMKNNGWFSVAIWLGAAPALGAQSQISIAVFDYIGLSDDVIASAVREGNGILRKAGIEAQWIVCDAVRDDPDGCSLPLPPSARYVSMLVVPKIRPMDAASNPGDIAGLALTGDGALGQPRGWVFYDAVERAAAKTHRSSTAVLGCVMVHEIGHVFGLKHRTGGVMRPDLDQIRADEAWRGWAFTAREAAQLRAGVVRLNTYWGMDPDHPASLR